MKDIVFFFFLFFLSLSLFLCLRRFDNCSRCVTQVTDGKWDFYIMQLLFSIHLSRGDNHRSQYTHGQMRWWMNSFESHWSEMVSLSFSKCYLPFWSSCESCACVCERIKSAILKIKHIEGEDWIVQWHLFKRFTKESIFVLWSALTSENDDQTHRLIFSFFDVIRRRTLDHFHLFKWIICKHADCYLKKKKKMMRILDEISTLESFLSVLLDKLD